MTMKRSRIVSAILAFLTILCGAALKIFRNFPPFLRIEIAILAILLAIVTVFVIVKWHRCPPCGKVIPITESPEELLYCNKPLS